MALWVIGDFCPSAQPPKKQLLKVEVLGVPASDNPLLIKCPDFPLSSESTLPSCYYQKELQSAINVRRWQIDKQRGAGPWSHNTGRSCL